MSQGVSTGKTQDRTYRGANLEIASRTIASEDYVMQISNIAQAAIGDIPRRKVSMRLVLICLLVAGVSMYVGTSGYRTNGFMVFLSLGALGVVAYHYFNVSQDPQEYGLTLELSSGASKFFISKDKAFLREVLALIDERMQAPGVHQEVFVARFAEGSIQNNYHSGTGDIITGGDVNKEWHDG